MRLRSSEVTTTENHDADDEKLLNCDSKQLVDGMVDNGANEAERNEYVNIAEDDFIVCVKEGDNSALDCISKENLKPSPLVSSADTCQLKVPVSVSSHKEEAMECNHWTQNVESVSLNDDDGENVVASTYGSIDADMMEKVKVEEADDAFTAIDGNCEGTIGVEKRKRGRKRKILVSSECNGELKSKSERVEKGGVQVSGRVLRSKTLTNNGGIKVADIGLNESVVGFKRKMEAECLDQTELNESVVGFNESTQKTSKKQKGRGRPPKVKDEVGSKRKINVESLDQIELQKEVDGSIPVIRKRLQKKQKRRGRPPKAQGEATPLYMVYDDIVSVQLELREKPSKVQGEVVKNLHRRGRPPKVKVGNSSTHVTNAKKQNCMVVKKTSNHTEAKDVKEGSKIHNKQKVEAFKESIDPTMAEEIVKGHNIDKDIVSEPLKSSIGGAERRKKQQLVRDQIVSMIMKAGWTIEYRPRQQREYLDAVYVDQNGRTHWSITKAYFALKKRTEDGIADSKEVSAFTPIPNEEMSVLFKCITKVRSDKNKKKNKRGKNDRKAQIVFSGEAPPKKKPGKKSKDGTKKKETHNSAVNLASKSSSVKVKGDKSRHKHGLIAGSSSQRQPKVSQKGRSSRKPKLVARSSNEGLDQGNDGSLYSGKRNLLSWMIDLGVIMPGGKVQYGEGRRRSGLSEGTVTRDGIQCSCCNQNMDISRFVSHGGGKLTEALKNICFQSGSSLLKCMLDSWRKEEKSSGISFNYVDINGDDPNDDTCNICGDGGDLICCDGCPSTFHHSCLDIQNSPSGDWHCIYCSCKFCGVVAGDGSQMPSDSEMLSCCLCEEKFHLICLQEEDAINADFSSLSFCGRKCQELFEQLQTYLGVKFELEEGYSWTLLQRSDVSQDSTFLDAPLKVECNSKLALAFAVMDECFVPIMDERSGVNTIHNVVYNCGSNFKRLNYSGFITAILEKGDELIAAASIRIHGHRLAEMPFIGTRHMYRRQGMCRRLLDAIEGALSRLGVGELVIPAIPELFKTWTKVFGFKPLEESKRWEMKRMSMMVFPGTDMLHKPLLNNQYADNNLGSVSVVASDDKSMETKTSNAIDLEQMEEATHLESETATVTSEIPAEHVLCYSDVRSCDDSFRGHGSEPELGIDENVGKNRFDLNLQPAADMQTMDDDESVLNDCKKLFEPSESRAHDSKSCAAQSLVLV